MDSEPFTSRALGAGIGRGGHPAPDRFGRVRVPGEKRAISCALRSDNTDAPSGIAPGRLAVGSALMLPQLLAADRLSPSARERLPQIGEQLAQGLEAAAAGAAQRCRMIAHEASVQQSQFKLTPMRHGQL
jgi:hypothetical protein